MWTGDIPVGATVTITSTATVNNPDTGDHVLTATAVSAAPGNNCPAGGTDPRCTPVTDVLTPALTITQVPGTTAAVPGQHVAYTVTITDTGQTAYAGEVVTESLAGITDDAVYGGDASATAGSVSYAAPVLTWTGDLTAGASAVITFTVTVDNPDTGGKLLITTVSSAATGSTCPPGTTTSPCQVTIPVLTPALTITATAPVTTTTPGSAVTYTTTITDTGQTTYTATTVTTSLAGVLADAAYNGGATATLGTLSYTAPALTWTGTLTPGQNATITYTITVLNPDAGNRTLTTTTATSAASGSNCPAGGTDPRCTTTITITSGVLSITVPATASLGSTVPGGTLSAGLGTVQVTDDRGFGASWTVTVSATPFITGAGTAAETMPLSDAFYDITALSQTTGTATFTTVPATTLTGSPQAVVSATNVGGNTTATWNPLLKVSIPASAIAGQYTATITQSVS